MYNSDNDNNYSNNNNNNHHFLSSKCNGGHWPREEKWTEKRYKCGRSSGKLQKIQSFCLKF